MTDRPTGSYTHERLIALEDSHADLIGAAKICLKAERQRRKKLLPKAPATTYCEKRIALIEDAIAKTQKLRKEAGL